MLLLPEASTVPQSLKQMPLLGACLPPTPTPAPVNRLLYFLLPQRPWGPQGWGRCLTPWRIQGQPLRLTTQYPTAQEGGLQRAPRALGILGM